MHKFKLWLILISIGLIAFDKYSFISNFRDSVVIWMQKQTSLLFYRIQSYPRLLLLHTTQQQELASQNTQLKKQIEEYSLLLKQSKNQTHDVAAVNQLNPNGVYDDFSQIVAKAILDVNFFVNNQSYSGFLSSIFERKLSCYKSIQYTAYGPNILCWRSSYIFVLKYFW